MQRLPVADGTGSAMQWSGNFILTSFCVYFTYNWESVSNSSIGAVG